MLEKFISLLFAPLTFALGFLAPLFMQLLDAVGWSTPMASNVSIAFAVAGIWGLLAQLRGSWIWLK